MVILMVSVCKRVCVNSDGEWVCERERVSVCIRVSRCMCMSVSESVCIVMVRVCVRASVWLH